jgi:hypothetical protein
LREFILPARGGLKLEWCFVFGLLVLERPELHGEESLVPVLVPVVQLFCVAYLLVL